MVTTNERPKDGQLTNERAAQVWGQCQAEKIRPDMRQCALCWLGCILTADTRM